MSTLKMVVVSLVAAMVIVFGAEFAFQTWDNLHTYYPKPENESLFLKGYRPEPVIAPFRLAQFNYAVASNNGGGAGKESVSHTSGFDWQFAMSSENELPLMTAMTEDLNSQLQAVGAKILGRSGDALTGFGIKYRVGSSVGTSVIHLLYPAASSIHRATPLPRGVEDVSLVISIAEVWYPETAIGSKGMR